MYLPFTTDLPDELRCEAEVLVQRDEDDPLDARHDELHHADHRVGRPIEDVAERQRGQPHDHRVRHGAAAHRPELDDSHSKQACKLICELIKEL